MMSHDSSSGHLFGSSCWRPTVFFVKILGLSRHNYTNIKRSKYSLAMGQIPLIVPSNVFFLSVQNVLQLDYA